MYFMFLLGLFIYLFVCLFVCVFICVFVSLFVYYFIKSLASVCYCGLYECSTSYGVDMFYISFLFNVLIIMGEQ